MTGRSWLAFALGLNAYGAVFYDQWWQRIGCCAVLVYYALRGIPS